MEKIDLDIICREGEGYKVEFKEKLSQLDREIVAFANAAGGTIYLGIQDDGKVCGITITNGLKSQLTDIAHNCDPSIRIRLEEYVRESVLAIHVAPGTDKPYKCRDGFFIRNGPSSQKLRRDEIIALASETGQLRFDETIHPKFSFPRDFSEEALREYLKACGIMTAAKTHDLLVSLNVANESSGHLQLTNAGALFFAKDPQRWIPESYITAVRYKTSDRFSIIDKRDLMGSPIIQIEQALQFVLRHTNVEAVFGLAGARLDVYEYPPVALREAIVNAVTHRDYAYDSSHIYIHIYATHIEIENPGGLFRGLSVSQLGERSVRRNRLIADLLHRARYIERVGSGFDRMKRALAENQNPNLEVSATNFFNIRFFPRVTAFDTSGLSSRQLRLYHLLENRGRISKHDAAVALQVSDDTALRELQALTRLGVAMKEGVGKATVYLLRPAAK